MLHYTEAGLSHNEVPDETSLCIYISGCVNRCKECHYPELQDSDYGDLLYKYIKSLIQLYLNQISCVCFLGEGRNTVHEKSELIEYCKLARSYGLKTCLYSGRDTEIEFWMCDFDYIKLGSFMPDKGALYEQTTNQRMYKKTENGYEDITFKFWKESKTR